MPGRDVVKIWGFEGFSFFIGEVRGDEVFPDLNFQHFLYYPNYRLFYTNILELSFVFTAHHTTGEGLNVFHNCRAVQTANQIFTVPCTPGIYIYIFCSRGEM